MKRYIKILTLFFTLSFLWGCLEDPEVYKVTVKTNSTVEFVQGGVALSGGIYTENVNYQPTIDSCGFCYGIEENPTLSNSVVKVKNSGVGDFNATLRSLNDGTRYYVRAFAQNKYGVVYGEEVSFVSLTKPIVKTLSLSEDNENSQLIVECELESLGSGDITELGVCYSSEKKLPNKENGEYKLVSNIHKGKYTVTITVKPNTKYYVRAFATNLAGIVYGEVKETLSYTVKFDGNGGSGTMKDIVVIPSEYIKLANNSFTRPGYFFVGWNTEADGSGISYSYNQSIKIEKDIILYAQWEIVGQATGSVGGHDFVDLGFPSGIKWATMNVGAESPEHPGDCYAWGEITAKSMDSWENYKWCDGSYNTLTKYCTSSSYGIVDNIETLERLDDVASVNWGSNWRMPTWEELDELLNTSYVTWTLCTLNGSVGYKITSKTNGNSIFMLACSSCGYWTSSLCINYTDKAYYLEFYHNLKVNWSRYSRCYNLYVRAVTNVSNTDTESVLPSIYNIKFNCNNGEGNMLSKTVSVGNSLSLPENTFTRSGYEFVGWNTNSNGAGISYSNGQTITPSGDMTLYAQWKKKEVYYTITFNANGGSGSMSSKTMSAGSSFYLPINTLTRSGYEFVGWNTNSYGTGTSYTDGQFITPPGNITLYAQWKKKEVYYTITFNANGGSGTMSSKTVSTGSSVTLPNSTFTRSGYEFVGWNTNADGSGVSYTNGQNITPSGNITLYAQWKKIQEEQEQLSGSHQGHDYVDLGLPSGTLWATCNVGATKAEEYGDYFAWGETESKDMFSWNTYKWCNGNDETMTKYCTSSSSGVVDNKRTLELSDDVAYAKWGGNWRMPTKSELDELKNSAYTIWIVTTKNGVSGCKVTSKLNGYSIFLPAVGTYDNSELRFPGERGDYWGRSLNTSRPHEAYILFFHPEGVSSGYISRRLGKSVRPVMSR